MLIREHILEAMDNGCRTSVEISRYVARESRQICRYLVLLRERGIIEIVDQETDDTGRLIKVYARTGVQLETQGRTMKLTQFERAALKRQEVLQAIEAGCWTAPEIAEYTGRPRDRIHHILQRLIDQGLVVRTDREIVSDDGRRSVVFEPARQFEAA